MEGGPRLGWMLGGELAVLQAPMFDGQAFDADTSNDTVDHWGKHQTLIVVSAGFAE